MKNEAFTLTSIFSSKINANSRKYRMFHRIEIVAVESVFFNTLIKYHSSTIIVMRGILILLLLLVFIVYHCIIWFYTLYE